MAATSITARNTIHGSERAVRHTGITLIHTRVANHAAKTHKSAVSTLVSTWPGNSTSAVTPSKGAMSTSAHTPTHAVRETTARAGLVVVNTSDAECSPNVDDP